MIIIIITMIDTICLREPPTALRTTGGCIKTPTNRQTTQTYDKNNYWELDVHIDMIYIPDPPNHYNCCIMYLLFYKYKCNL